MRESPRRSLLFLVAAPVLFLLITGYGCFGPIGTVACGNAVGFSPAIIESLNACAQVTEKLGAPVEFSRWGLTFGNWESGREAGEGLAYGALPVTGRKACAELDYVLSKSGGVWSSTKLILTFADGSKLDVKACTASLERARGTQAADSLLVNGCEEGQAALCLALAVQLEARNELEAARAARVKACQLGLAEACAAK